MEISQPAAHSPAGPIQEYCRSRDLPRLIALWPDEIHDYSVDGRRKLIAKLERALREERRRGSAGHWAYDVARHAGIAHALRAERAIDRRLPLAGQHGSGGED